MKQANQKTFNRYEIKYLISYQKAQQIIKDLHPFVVPDEFGDKNGKYVLTSLYYDTRDFRFYHEKINGLRHRKKLRIRLYETPEPATKGTPVFVEIKERIDRIIRKRRVRLVLEDAMDLCNNNKDIHCNAGDRSTMDEIVSLLRINRLQPTIITSYERQAFHGTRFDKGLRITFDTNVRYRRNNLDLMQKDIGDLMIPRDMCIMEIKVNNSIPVWLTQLIANHDLSIDRVSKYCLSLEQAHNRTQNINYSFA